MGPNCSFDPKDNFWQNWLSLLSTHCTLLCYNILKIPQSANHETESCITLAWIGCELP